MEWIKTSAQNTKHGRSTILEKENVFRLDLNESGDGFCRRGRGRSFHIDRKGAGNNSGESGARNLEAETKYQKRSGEYGKVCKVVRMILHNTGCICTPQHRMN